MTSIRRFAIGTFFVSALLLIPATARAQYAATPFHDPSTGETYHVEAAVAFWSPSPDLTVASAQFGLAGTQISAINDLGIEPKTLIALRMVLRPARKHKFRINYLPMHYTAESLVHRTFDF